MFVCLFVRVRVDQYGEVRTSIPSPLRGDLVSIRKIVQK